MMVFSIVRDFMGGNVANIPYENMNDVDKLLGIVSDILLARQLQDLVIEEELYCELIELFRSPEQLIVMTKERPDKKTV